MMLTFIGGENKKQCSVDYDGYCIFYYDKKQLNIDSNSIIAVNDVSDSYGYDECIIVTNFGIEYRIQESMSNVLIKLKGIKNA